MSTHKEGLQNYIVRMQEHMRTDRRVMADRKEHIRHYKATIKNGTEILKGLEKAMKLNEESIVLSKKSIAETRERLKTEE